MTKQEALEELKSRVRCADWIDEDYVDCVSKKALKVAIEVMEREVSMCQGLGKMVENITQSGEIQEIRALLQEEEVKQMIKKHHGLLELIDERLIKEREESIEVGMELIGTFQKEVMLRLLKYSGYDCEVFSNFDDFVTMKVRTKTN